MKKAKQGAVPVPKKNLWKQIAKHWEFYVLLLPGIILTIIFKYVPMYGVQIAFRDYNPVGGFFYRLRNTLELFPLHLID